MTKDLAGNVADKTCSVAVIPEGHYGGGKDSKGSKSSKGKGGSASKSKGEERNLGWSSFYEQGDDNEDRNEDDKYSSDSSSEVKEEQGDDNEDRNEDDKYSSDSSSEVKENSSYSSKGKGDGYESKGKSKGYGSYYKKHDPDDLRHEYLRSTQRYCIADLSLVWDPELDTSLDKPDIPDPCANGKGASKGSSKGSKSGKGY